MELVLKNKCGFTYCFSTRQMQGVCFCIMEQTKNEQRFLGAIDPDVVSANVHLSCYLQTIQLRKIPDGVKPDVFHPRHHLAPISFSHPPAMGSGSESDSSNGSQFGKDPIFAGIVAMFSSSWFRPAFQCSASGMNGGGLYLRYEVVRIRG